MKELFSDVLQQVMEAELEEKLGYEKSERMTENAESGHVKNYRNGYSKKTVKTQLGEVDIKVPRDRNGEYEPQIIGKYSRNADGMEEKILALYSCGMSQRDIADQIKNLYDVEISDGLVSKIVEKITPEITAWQNRPLESVYPFIFMDAIHYKVKENHQYITKAAYIVLGIQLDGHKDILGVWIGEHESAKFWLSVMNDLRNRGIKDVYVFCVDGLNGFREAMSVSGNNINGDILNYQYDPLKRLSEKSIAGQRVTFNQKYSYKNLSSSEATMQISSLQWYKGTTEALSYSYLYDAIGNITHVYKDNSLIARYTYDEQSQLLTEILYDSDIWYEYTYDTYGNIRSVNKYQYSTNTLLDTEMYSYTDST